MTFIMTGVQRYQDYLASKQWMERRAQALLRAGNKCEQAGCDETQRLDVHHITYERLGHEEDGDLMVLCREHHRFYEWMKSNRLRDRQNFENWMTKNFGEEWRDDIDFYRAKEMYQNSLKG